MPYYFTREEHWNDVGTALIAVVDIISGLIIYFSSSFSLASLLPILFLSFFYIVFGLWSILTNVMRRNYLDWRGYIDVINAVCLFSIYSEIVLEIFWLLGIIIILKGGLSFFLITTKRG